MSAEDTDFYFASWKLFMQQKKEDDPDWCFLYCNDLVGNNHKTDPWFPSMHSNPVFSNLYIYLWQFNSKQLYSKQKIFAIQNCESSKCVKIFFN